MLNQKDYPDLIFLRHWSSAKKSIAGDAQFFIEQCREKRLSILETKKRYVAIWREQLNTHDLFNVKNQNKGRRAANTWLRSLERNQPHF